MAVMGQPTSLLTPATTLIPLSKIPPTTSHASQISTTSQGHQGLLRLPSFQAPDSTPPHHCIHMDSGVQVSSLSGLGKVRVWIWGAGFLLLLPTLLFHTHVVGW